MGPKVLSPLFPWLFLLTLILLLLYSSLLSSPQPKPIPTLPSCNLFNGHWVQDPDRTPMYDESCPFHRNAWNCLRNKRDNMGVINSWKWVPRHCDLPRIDPVEFLGLMRNRNIGFVGDSLNENMLVSFLCLLRAADLGAKKWKRKGAWRGAYFPKFNVTVGYHRAVLLAKYEWYLSLFDFEDCSPASLLLHWKPAMTESRWRPKQHTDGDQDGLKGIYQVDVDIPSDDWANIGDFYDVLVFNTGHWWGFDKFPKETPLTFYRAGEPIYPPLDILSGFKVVVENMASYIQNKVPLKTLKFWRLQSPRHFHGGDWNQNGSCLFNKPLEEQQLDLWFDPSNNGPNKEERQLNRLIEDALQGTDIQLLNLTHLSEFRADAHPAIWLGQKDAVKVWGQDCMHWCLPGVPDTWVDILSQLIHIGLEMR